MPLDPFANIEPLIPLAIDVINGACTQHEDCRQSRDLGRACLQHRLNTDSQFRKHMVDAQIIVDRERTHR